MTSKNLQDTLQEIKILQQLKDSRARDYVNIIDEARTVHNELWIVSEYASGGSVNTLMKPRVFLSKTGLEEKYIIPIARELAKGLKYIHEAGVIHRDLKCNNILVNEQGRVQLCDFGVSGALEPEIAKRSTIVGTPFWMAPEIHEEWVKEADPRSMARPKQILYGSEVDIWAYGCTLYEMATGYPPFHTTKPFELQEAGIPTLDDPKYSDGLKSLISFVMKRNAQDRPTADQILEHPYLFDTEKMFPDFTLIQLVENYYRWEQGGGSRASLFNPFGAQAPDPLAPEPEDDEDWNFSTSEEFEKQHFNDQATDPFTDRDHEQAFTGINAPPADDDRFARLQASFRKEAADRGGKRLNRLFNTEGTPYRYSMLDSEPGMGRPPSDLVLRDFDTGAPNRETVIDLDIALPTVSDVPSIDLGEVPTVRANRNRMTRDSLVMDDEERDVFDMDQTARRATRDWKFPDNRRTMDWQMPALAEQTNRRTMEWTFDASMAEATQEPLPIPSRLSRRRDTQELTLSSMTAPTVDNRRTQDFVFPPRDPTDSGSLSSQGLISSSPTLDVGFDDYPQINSAPSSPLRNSMIDLDMATVESYRPSTSGSTSTSTFTAGTETLNGNPFDLEDQVHLSQTNNRASYHMKSQSEPNQAIPGLLTPQTYDEQGYPINQDPHHPSMHARGVSSVSQMQAKLPANNIGYGRQRMQQPAWEGWNHQAAYSIDGSPPASVSTSTSTEDEDYDEMWDALERRVLQSERRHFSGFRSRRTASQDEDPRSDAEDNYASEYEDLPSRQSRVSVGPNGRPFIEFPVPRGPDPEALLGADADPNVLMNALWKSTVEMRDGLRTSTDLLKAMHLKETVQRVPEESDDDTESNSTLRT